MTYTEQPFDLASSNSLIFVDQYINFVIRLYVVIISTFMKRKIKPIGIDLFCGVGGLSLGFKQAGFDVAASVDNDPTNIEMYSKNFPGSTCILADIAKISGKEIRSIAKIGNRRVHVVFGGPPCQGFSMIGKRRPDDARNSLIYDFARLVREIKPYYFVLENVPGILTKNMKSILESFIRRIKRAGYLIVEPIQTINAFDFEIPQRRERVVILGYSKCLPAPSYSNLVNTEKDLPNPPTVWDAIGDLFMINKEDTFYNEDTYKGKFGQRSDYVKMLHSDKRVKEKFLMPKRTVKGLTGCQLVNHSDETIRRFKMTAPGTVEPISHFYRLNKSGVAPTLRAGSDRLRGLFTAARPIHPTEPRCITTREAARLHSFPDWFQFHSKKCHAFRQIGNSVPPKMAKALAQVIINMFM